jgi:hypothetical protein
MVGGTSKQMWFESAAEETTFGRLWKTKFEDKAKSLVRSSEDGVQVIQNEKVGLAASIHCLCIFSVCSFSTPVNG